MELICRIQMQSALQEREITTRQGQKEMFAPMPFLLVRGDETFFAEMIQEQERKQCQLDVNYYYKAQLQPTVTTWRDQQGVERFTNQLRLTKITVL